MSHNRILELTDAEYRLVLLALTTEAAARDADWRGAAQSGTPDECLTLTEKIHAQGQKDWGPVLERAMSEARVAAEEALRAREDNIRLGVVGYDPRERGIFK